MGHALRWFLDPPGSKGEDGETVIFDIDTPDPPISTFRYPGSYGLFYVPFEE